MKHLEALVYEDMTINEGKKKKKKRQPNIRVGKWELKTTRNDRKSHKEHDG